MTATTIRARVAAFTLTCALLGALATTGSAQCPGGMPEHEPNDTDAQASANNAYIFTLNSAGVGFQQPGETDGWVFRNASYTNKLRLTAQVTQGSYLQDCIGVDVYKCTTVRSDWAHCPWSEQEQVVNNAVCWNGANVSTFDFTVGENHLLLVNIAPLVGSDGDPYRITLSTR